MKGSREPNLGDVAALAGVSPTTVSRVLNNRGYLSQATKDAVAEAIEQLNYRPNEVARSLLGKATRVVGIIVPTTAHPFFGEISAALENALAARGYRALICNSQGRRDKEIDYLHQLDGRRVDGLIVGAHNDSIEEYETTRLPIVMVDRQVADQIPNVRAYNLEGGRLATQLLLDAGSTRPALITSSLGPANLREEGYRRAVAQAGVEPLVACVEFGTPEPRHTELLSAALDRLRDKADGVFATDDLTACSVADWASGAGLRVPEDLKIVGFDGTSAIRIAAPWLSTVLQPISQIAATAVEVLLARIGEGGGDIPPRESLVLPVSVLESRSTGGANAARQTPPSVWSL